MILQNRWRSEGKRLVYYGVRKSPYTNKNKIRISGRECKIISALPDMSGFQPTNKIKRLIADGVLIEESQLRKTPKSVDDAVFCKNCIANDFIIPGLEFDENGFCPMCAAKKRDEKLVSILPIKQKISRAKNSRFDVAVFYTGGKDSTYLLYYYAKVLKLRVLALTWEIPFMSDNARQSIENAKKHLPGVEFINRFIAPEDLKRFYRKLLKLQNNACACPSLAYVLFYPLLCSERVPYLALGNEPVQMKQLYYNKFAPKIAYKFQQMKFVHILLNIGRLITFKKPLRSGQLEFLLLIKQLANGDSILKRIAGYKNETVSNVCTAMDEIPALKKTLKKELKKSDRMASFPALVHLDFNSISAGGKYDWQKVKDLLIEECGWVPAPSNGKNLHTSCRIEKAKDYTQFIRFYNMETEVIPFSALEIALASAGGNLSKEEAIIELKNSLGISLTPPEEYHIMCSYCSDCNAGENKND